MMRPPYPPPQESELHGYVDGELDAARQAEISDWLSRHPDAAASVHAWGQQNAALRAAFAPILQEPLPEPLQTRLRAGTGVLPAWRRSRLAAALAWLVIGAFLGYGARGSLPPASSAAPQARSAPAQNPPMVHLASIAHTVYTPEVRHPVEVTADQEAHLLQWLSKRLGTRLQAPQLSAHGFTLVGGRLLPAENGPAAQFMYQDASGLRITLYIRQQAQHRETAFRHAVVDRLSAFYWVEGDFGYVLTGELPRSKLLALAESTYQQLQSVP